MYINTNTMQYPVSQQDIRNLNPNTSFPEPFTAPSNFKVVFPSAKPVYNTLTQVIVEDTPKLSSAGNYEQQWKVLPKFQEYTDEQGVVHTVAEQEEAAINAALDTLRKSKWESIKSYRSNLTQTGGYKVGTKWFHSDTFSRSQQLGLVMMGNSIPQGLMWKTMDGSFVEMTTTLAQQIFHAAAMQDSAIFAYAESLNTQVQQSDDIEFIQNLDIKQGWPETYVE